MSGYFWHRCLRCQPHFGPQHVDVVNIDYKKALVLILSNFEAFWLADKATSV